jgi:hypothetical protein
MQPETLPVGIFSRAKQERLREAHWFLGYIQERISTADVRLGPSAERGKKELGRLASLVQVEIDKLEPPVAMDPDEYRGEY